MQGSVTSLASILSMYILDQAMISAVLLCALVSAHMLHTERVLSTKRVGEDGTETEGNQ